MRGASASVEHPAAHEAERRTSAAPYPCHVDVRIVLGCALVGALAAGTVAAAGERDYRVHSYVIHVPPGYTGERGLELAGSDAVLGRTLALAGEEGRGAKSLTGHRPHERAPPHHARQVPIVALIALTGALPNVRAVLVR
jgi:hypothetical protein